MFCQASLTLDWVSFCPVDILCLSLSTEKCIGKACNGIHEILLQSSPSAPLRSNARIKDEPTMNPPISSRASKGFEVQHFPHQHIGDVYGIQEIPSWQFYFSYQVHKTYVFANCMDPIRV